MTLLLLALLVVHMASAAILLFATGVAIWAMSRSTSHWVRAAYVLLAVGAFAALLYPFYFTSWHPTPETLVILGAAILLVANKRGAIINLGRELFSPLR